MSSISFWINSFSFGAVRYACFLMDGTSSVIIACSPFWVCLNSYKDFAKRSLFLFNNWYNVLYTGQKIIYSTYILHISYTYQYPICVVLYNINAENPTHIVYT
jgi:hypothetical protein